MTFFLLMIRSVSACDTDSPTYLPVNFFRLFSELSDFDSCGARHKHRYRRVLTFVHGWWV